MNGKSLTFNCFRKMMLSASIDSGIGLTAGKKLVGKAISQSDDTYLTTINLKKKFIQLKNFQTIKQQPKVEVETIESLKKAVINLQEDLRTQTTISNTISEEYQKMKQEMKELEEGLKEFEGEIMERLVETLSNFGKGNTVTSHKAAKEATQTSSVSKEENNSKT